MIQVEGIFAGGVTEPYIEEIYNSNIELLSAKLFGYQIVRNYLFWNSSELTDVILPETLSGIGNYAFYGCKKLSLNTLPSAIETIGAYAFSGCSNLGITSIPSGIFSILAEAFSNCTKITSLTFNGTPMLIASDAFSGCTNLTTINVPWLDGEVDGAPWGATNATINYNYTGG